MGLEKLKSVFTEGFQETFERSPISGRESDYQIGGTLGEGEVDFFGGNNSYKAIVDPPVPGFTKNFNFGGYTFADGDIGNSKYLNILSDTQIRSTDVDLTDLTTNKLGFGEFSSDSIYGEFTDDIRFTPGLGWPFANTILQVSQECNQCPRKCSSPSFIYYILINKYQI